MNNICKTIGYKSLSALNRIIPKQDKIVMYAGNRLYDNTEAVFTYLVRNTNYRITCIADQHMDYGSMRQGVIFYKNSLFRVIYELLTCRVCVDSFLRPVKIEPTKKQMFLQLWHGSPLKSGKGIRFGKYYSKICYASRDFKKTVREQFGVSDDKMFLNGNPRNDYLFNPIGIEFSNVERVKRHVIWMPTFRQGLGREEGGDALPLLSCENVEELNAFLAERDIVLYIKPHPHQKKGFSEIISGKSHILIIDDALLHKNNIPLYRFLGSMDALLTDYSSVFFDYLLLNKPIGFVISDIEEYRAGRGFSFEDPEKLMPGERIRTFDALKKFFEDLLRNEDPFADERKRVCSITNFYKDNRSCERVKALIREKMERE